MVSDGLPGAMLIEDLCVRHAPHYTGHRRSSGLTSSQRCLPFGPSANCWGLCWGPQSKDGVNPQQRAARRNVPIAFVYSRYCVASGYENHAVRRCRSGAPTSYWTVVVASRAAGPRALSWD